MSIEAMTKAHAAIELLIEDWTDCFRDGEHLSDVPADNQMRLKVLAVMRGLREAIAKAEKQEPVAFRWKGDLFTNPVPLYEHPCQWVGLTDEDIDNLELPPSGTATVRDFVRLIEAKLKEKNETS
jgi:hypothetical protein